MCCVYQYRHTSIFMAEEIQHHNPEKKVSSLKSLLWEIKNALYVLFFDSQFHRLQSRLLHQAHPTACYCVSLQRKLVLHKIPFHDTMALPVMRRQHYPSNTVLLQQKTICVNFNCQSDATIVTLLHQQHNCAHNSLLCTVRSTVHLHSFAIS